MERRITTSVTYNLPIKDFDCVKAFLSELPEISKRLRKSDYWVPFVESQINGGLKVVFIHLWNTDDQWFEGVHYKEEMVFEAFMGFHSIGMTLYSMGEFLAKNIDALCKKYEDNPDFIFTQLDWSAPKEEIIKNFISDLMDGDFVEDDEVMENLNVNDSCDKQAVNNAPLECKLELKGDEYDKYREEYNKMIEQTLSKWRLYVKNRNSEVHAENHSAENTIY